MNSPKRNWLGRLWNAGLTPGGFLVRAALIALFFAACHVAGWREHTTFLSGTAASAAGSANTSIVLGVVYMEINERAQAEENLQRALRLEPANPEINNNYGWFLCRTGRERESVQYFDRALRDPLYATPARALQNTGLCLARVQDYTAAETYLRRAFEIEPGNASIQFELARVNLARGQLERATFYYQLLTKEAGEAASAPVLWLGVRLARAGGDLRTETRRARLLAEKFPGSPEAARLQKGQFDE